MSLGISNTDLIDLQRTTLQNLPDMEFEVALKYQDYSVVNRWFADNKKQIESGTSIERNIVLDTTGNAKHVKLYQKTPINVGDTQQKITAPWCQVQTHYSIERREALRNRAPARYIDLLKSRRIDATVDLANLLEERGWAAPLLSSDDLNPRGIPYWISKSMVGVTGASGYDANIDVDQSFAGRRIMYGNSATNQVINSKAGLDPTANARWRNYAAIYTSVNNDFVKRLRRAFHATKFRSPVIASDLKKGPKANFKIYVGLDVLTEYEDLATKQNDNNGSDLDKFHGNTTFRGVEIVYTPVLDSDTDQPIYGVNHDKFVPLVLDGDWMRESDPMMDVEQHNVITTFLDGSYQYLCTNVREGGFVLHKQLAA